MRFDTYNEYKAVQKLFEVPSHWEICRLKDLGFLQNGISKSKEYFGSGHPFVSYGNVYNDSININQIVNLANSSTQDQKLYSVKSGDVFFTRTSETIDEIGIASTCLSTVPKATFSGFTIRFRPRKKILKEYSKFYFKAHFYRTLISRQISLVTRASLGQGILYNLNIALPPKLEQTQIANYLDKKTTAIDNKIYLLEQKAKKYKELKKSIINETVCRGLNKDVKLKNSGIEWLGDIPEHWEVIRVKGFCKTIKGKNLSNSDIPFKNSLNLLSLDYLRNDKTTFSSYCISENKSLIATENDLIIVWDGAAAGEIIKSKKGYISSTIAKLVFNKRILLPKYFYFLKENIEYMLQKIPTGMGIPHLNPLLLNNFHCPVPPIVEQKEILKILDYKTTIIDKITKNITTQITTLKELKKTLINDVVTGKIKVSQ
ncbi:hypothetical protein HNS38_16510 [Lentimicrobium sp. L6]|uniref:restriction endonuclease subunit S n=1 Tax=Lentimicrobium sp. L6 TaxID=2735916 RepID=UPI0015573317|nr:restriction endonuclease subunit S [Lentimicrobium sp. L6]NPD86376.1 hypothetical protein [Lentimicrobium sp. L6]